MRLSLYLVELEGVGAMPYLFTSFPEILHERGAFA
jgi:hypothetical protein